MHPFPRTARYTRHLQILTVCAAALCAGTALLAPAAAAKPAAAESVVCESTARGTLQAPQLGSPTRFTGTGTITCRNEQGEPYLEGKTEFSGTLPSPTADAKPESRSRVEWSDGKVTTGTFTDFGTEVGDDGVLKFTIKGVNDAASTRFGGYTVSITGHSVREVPDPTGEIHTTEQGQVLYTP
ncbi:hypothetical protein OG730_10415 [Streptomyces sp. NBC_01298]|uniref:hypothetical protein n=1 Tax=Streptomyces sp. NBC_01298 TaxID=2903817 RepID=UPI002E1089A5|nr:hypothetical protein OG730_10415 [Streptomyces sp. NBC_01298]